MRAAMRHLRLDRLDVVHVGRDTFPLAEGIRAVAGGDIWSAIEPL